MSIIRLTVFLAVIAMPLSTIPMLAQVSSSAKIDDVDEASWRQVQKDILAQYGISVVNRTAVWSTDELIRVLC